MPTFSVYTLGCKLNFSESSEMARQLVSAGFEQLPSGGDHIIVNSCAVTATAEKKARNEVSHLHRLYPDAQIVVVGCYAALRPDEIRQWPGVSQVFGNRDKMNAVAYLQRHPLCPAPHFFAAYSSNDRTRSFLKIQDGCNNHCTYCTVADARGESRSDNIDNVLQNIEKIKRENIKEIILTGVNLGDFGRGTGENFYDLLRAIEKQHLVERFRISSIEPQLLSDDIMELVSGSEIIMPHFHIPLQSGCDKILHLMKRRYTTKIFANKIEAVKRQIPDACIALDVITGFPTESDEDFENSYQFLDQLPISYLHVFTYSRRPGTPANEMEGQVPPEVKHERTNRLLELSEKHKRNFYKEHAGESRPVLWESSKKNGKMFGFTDNYIKVCQPYDAACVNEILPICLTSENCCD